MTMPTTDGQSADPTAVILARMEVKLDNALTEQSRHTSTLDRHDRVLGEHGNRLTAFEASGATLNRLDKTTGELGNRVTALETTRTTTNSNRSAMWAAIAAIASVVAVVLGVLLAIKGG